MEYLNIEKVGPGGWYMLHMLAAYSKTSEQIEGFNQMLRIVSNHFFCPMCREHFRKNYLRFPPPNTNKEDELFLWTVEMHNRVNAINDKPIITYRDAINFYAGGISSCSGNCSSKKDRENEGVKSIARVLSSEKRFTTVKKKYNL